MNRNHIVKKRPSLINEEIMKKRENKFFKESLDHLIDNDINLEDRKIYLYGFVDEEMAKMVRKYLDYFQKQDKSKPVILDINSEGGYVYDALSIVDSITSSKLKIITLASGLCASGASLIFVCGDYRVAHENTSFMLHEISTFEADRHSQIKSSVKHNDNVMNQLYHIYVKHSNIKKSELRTKMLRDWYMTAQEAKERKLVDEIIIGGK
jgi:ATP-dependent Clp protease protease subunit